jgi:uncharacterized membrane protein YbaN (DUF454 family)
MTASKPLLVLAGSVSVVLGVLGVFLPLLPTTPFFLLAAICYARSSPRLHYRLLTNRLFGSYIRNYCERKGVPLRVKIAALALLVLTITYSAIFIVDILFVRILLFGVMIGVSIHLVRLPVLRSKR